MAPKVTRRTSAATIVVRVDQNKLYLYDGFHVDPHLQRGDGQARLHHAGRRLEGHPQGRQPHVVQPGARQLGRRPARSRPGWADGPHGHAGDLHRRGSRPDPHPRHAVGRLDRAVRLARLHPDAQLRDRAALPAGPGRRPRHHRGHPSRGGAWNGTRRPRSTSSRPVLVTLSDLRSCASSLVRDTSRRTRSDAKGNRSATAGTSVCSSAPFGDVLASDAWKSHACDLPCATMRTCAKMRCEAEPVATVSLRYAEREVVVVDLLAERDPQPARSVP